MRFYEFREYKKGSKGHAKGKDPMPKTSKPSKTGEQPHPLKGKLVGESLTEAKVGREFNHLEDLVFVDGADGAARAADLLARMGEDNSDIAIKWDGNPTVYWGRESDGTFVLVGKNGWGKNKSTDSGNLANFIKNSGKGEEWREKFGNDMAKIFDIMKNATPPDFRGYVFGDLLYHPGKPYIAKDGKLEFTPNKVTYTVDTKSDIGKRMSQSQVGIAVHGKYEEFGDKVGQPIKDVSALNGEGAVVLGQTYVTHQPSIDTKEVDQIRSLVGKVGSSIDKFLQGTTGLSNPANIIYTYMNHMTRTKQLDKIDSGFFDWLATSKVSKGQQQKLAQLNDENPQALPGMFALIKKIMAAKDHIIDQLDSADSDVKATTAGEKGGEGYVALGSKTKLVPRTRWQPN